MCNQVKYNLDERGIENDVLPYCTDNGLSVIAYTPISKGEASGDPVFRDVVNRSGMMGGSRAQYHLRQSFVFLDSRIINRPEVIINSVDKKINEKGEFQDENSEKFMIDLLKNLVSEVREQRTR